MVCIQWVACIQWLEAQVPAEWLEADIYGTDESQCSKAIDFVYPGFDAGYAFECRAATQSQVNLLDVLVGEVLDSLRAVGLWDSTLVVFQSDNGGHVQTDSGAGNNWPLRGGKETDFEGGVRAISFVTGGLLPDHRRGDVETGYVHTCDWYTTFCALAGVNPTDEAAADAGLPAVDGLDMWSLIRGKVSASPRTEMLISDTTLISCDWKLMQGKFRYAVWQSPVWPMASTPSQDVLEDTVLDCVGNHGDAPCLFNIREDESEYVNVARLYPDTVAEMQARLAQLKAGFLAPDDFNLLDDSCLDDYLLAVTIGADATSKELGCGCWMALYNYNGFDGLYQGLEDKHIMFDVEALLGGSGGGCGVTLISGTADNVATTAAPAEPATSWWASTARRRALRPRNCTSRTERSECCEVLFKHDQGASMLGGEVASMVTSMSVFVRVLTITFLIFVPSDHEDEPQLIRM